jgi:hypothetical protein
MIHCRPARHCGLPRPVSEKVNHLIGSEHYARAPPRLGQGHPSSSVRPSDPPSTELALAERQGAGARPER